MTWLMNTLIEIRGWISCLLKICLKFVWNLQKKLFEIRLKFVQNLFQIQTLNKKNSEANFEQKNKIYWSKKKCCTSCKPNARIALILNVSAIKQWTLCSFYRHIKEWIMISYESWIWIIVKDVDLMNGTRFNTLYSFWFR